MLDSVTNDQAITLEDLVDLLCESETLSAPFSKGGCTTHRVKHPKHGQLILIETPNSKECQALKI